VARRRSEQAPAFNSLVAAAEIMTAPSQPLRMIANRSEAWQTAAWDYYDSIGELRFACQWISNAVSRVNLVAAAPPTGPGDEPTVINPDDPSFTSGQRRAAEIVSQLAGGSSGQGQMLGSFGVHLTVAGIGWLVAEPSLDDPFDDSFATWNVYSSDEIRTTPAGTVEVRASYREWRELHPNSVVVKAWRRHPRWSYQPDAPTRGVLSVLREIELLQQHIHASAQSRLAGAGILTIPSEAVFPPGQGPQSSYEDITAQNQNITAPEDNFVDTLVDSMTVPIMDRSSAAAVVPLVIRIPGEYVDKVKHITFATPFDDRVLSLMESAIKRLALGLDIPPEILTGTGGMNHWGAWQVEEQAITLHIEPLSELICHALTVGFLAAALESEGFDPSEAMVWYDTSDLTARPDKTRQAIEAYDRMELSAEAMLREVGLSVDDMPSDDEKRNRILIALLQTSPDLAPAILSELGYAVPERIEVQAAPSPPAIEAPQGPPETINGDALLAACDVLMHRAMERAGARLRSAAGKRTNGGAASIPCDDPTRLHCSIDATSFADLGSLLDGAWVIVPDIASRCRVDPDRLTSSLDRYARAILATGEPHTHDRLAHALGTT
jgi:hypothetical protein